MKYFQTYLVNVFAVKLLTLQNNGFQSVGEKQRPVIISHSSAIDDDDDGNDDADGDDFEFTSRQ